MNNKATRIPCIMYHSIGIVEKEWHWNHLTCPYEVFADQLKWLKRTGYKTLNFQEVYDYIMHDKPVPKKCVFLTFDDGYVDNYVYAFPLLKKFRMKGTMFVNPYFVEKSKGLRKTLDDVDQNMGLEELQTTGFCNWDELRQMDSLNVLDVQSHAKTHTWYPISDKIIDFRHPNDEYNWMDWNANPDQKPYLQCLNGELNQLGQAVFEHEKALSSKRVFINPEFQLKLQTFVSEMGGEAFYKKKDWKVKLTELADKLKKEISVVLKQESEEEYFQRIEFELDFTKKEIEKQLSKEVRFLCWPGGSATKEGVKISEKLGYLMSSAARDIPVLRKKIKNTRTHKINRIARFTPVMYSTLSKPKKKPIILYSSGWYFVLQLMKFQNRNYAGYWIRGLQFIVKKIISYVY